MKQAFFFLFSKAEQVKLLLIHQIPSSAPNLPTVQLPLFQQNCWRKFLCVEIQAWRRMHSLCSEQLPGGFQVEFKCWLSWKLFQRLIFLWFGVWWYSKCSSVSCGAFLITWNFSDHLIAWNGVMEWCFTSQGWGAALPGSRWKMLQAPSVEHPYLPWCSSFCASFMEKDDHRFPAQQCGETHGKPGQSCPKPLLQRVPGFPEEQEELRGLEIQQPSHIPFLMFPSSLLPRKHFCFWTLIRCISVILKNLLFVHSAAVSMFFPCFSLIRKEFK